MADTTNVIKGITVKASDGSSQTISTPALQYIQMSSKNNLEMASPKKLNLEADRNIVFKPGQPIQFQTQKQHKEDTTTLEDTDEMKIKIINDDVDRDDNVQGLKMSVAGIQFVNGEAQETDYTQTGASESNSITGAKETYKGKWDPWKFPLHFKQVSTKDVDVWTDLKMNARSIDIRARAGNMTGTISDPGVEHGPGTGGGIAVQIASCDGDCHENKFKIETSRKVDAFEGQLSSDDSTTLSSADYSDVYDPEGGTGIEIVTINSQYESFYTTEMRRAGATKVFATRRIMEPWVEVYHISVDVENSDLFDEKKKPIRVAELKDGNWDSKKLENGDDIVHVLSGDLSGNWYKGLKCKPDNQIMALNKASSEDGVATSPTGTTYMAFDINYLSDYCYKVPAEEDKSDYLTQSDDTKDIPINEDNEVLWIDLINTALYLKQHGRIPNNGKLLGDSDATYETATTLEVSGASE